MRLHAVILSVCMAFGMHAAPHTERTKEAAHAECVVLVWSDLLTQTGDEMDAQSVWDSYIAAGWYGDARDHMEALWAPACTDADTTYLIDTYHL